MEQPMNNSRKPWLMLATLIVVAVVTAILTTAFGYPLPPDVPPPFAIFRTIGTVIGVLNLTLLVILLATYADIYRKTKSEFTIGLVIFSLILLLQSIFSNPFIYPPFGFYAERIGPFLIFPPLFIFVALMVLLYLTIK
jgi:hypothetical protein